MDYSKHIKTKEPSIIETAVPCLICGEDIISTGISYAPKVCDKCKAAVMKVRKESEGAE